MNPTDVISFTPIGVIHTPYKDKAGAPRQPGAHDEEEIGIISLFPGKNFEQALSDLDGFSHVWIISHFDRNAHWRPKVLPPRGGDVRRGVFATRSPHRPNPIGLSLCRLISVSGRTLRVANPDLLDGTPILDIKPYLPGVEAVAGASSGWLEGLDETPFEISLEPLAHEQLSLLVDTFGIDLLQSAHPFLSQAPFPHPYRRIKMREDGGLVIGVKSWRIEYHVEKRNVVIERIASGYEPGVNPEHDPEAHEGFRGRYGK